MMIIITRAVAMIIILAITLTPAMIIMTTRAGTAITIQAAILTGITITTQAGIIITQAAIQAEITEVIMRVPTTTKPEVLRGHLL